MNFNLFFIKKIAGFKTKHWVVETTNYCNLRCPICENCVMKRKKGFMTVKQFKHCLKELNSIGVKSIDLDLGGEPTLHPDLVEMIKLAKARYFTIGFTTNGTQLHYQIKELIESGVDNILIDFDGMTKESYLKMRVGSNFEKVKQNIENLIKTKKKLKKRKPKIALSFIINKFNENEIKDFIKWGKIADSIIIKTISINSKTPKIAQQTNDFMPLNKEFCRNTPKKDCDWIDSNGVIFWNGDIGLCCSDVMGTHTFGNVYSTPLKEIITSKAYLQRKQNIEEKNYWLCKHCKEFKTIKIGDLNEKNSG